MFLDKFKLFSLHLFLCAHIHAGQWSTTYAPCKRTSCRSRFSFYHVGMDIKLMSLVKLGSMAFNQWEIWLALKLALDFQLVFYFQPEWSAGDWISSSTRKWFAKIHKIMVYQILRIKHWMTMILWQINLQGNSYDLPVYCLKNSQIGYKVNPGRT